MTDRLLAFAVLAGLLTLVPGLDTALVLRAALTQRRLTAFATALGIAAGLLVWGVAASVGLSALLRASEVAFDALRFAGALYMAWIGLRLLRDAIRRPTALPDAVVVRDETAWSGFRRGFLTNLLNPKIGVFYIAVLPQFLPPAIPSVVGGVALPSVHVLESLLWFTVIILAAQAARGWLEGSRFRRSVDAVTGVALLAFSVRLALSRA